MYFDDLDYIYDDEYGSATNEWQWLVIPNIVEPLKLTSADDCLASPDDWLDTILFIRGIK
jgi:hypothetical protein